MVGRRTGRAHLKFSFALDVYRIPPKTLSVQLSGNFLSCCVKFAGYALPFTGFIFSSTISYSPARQCACLIPK